MTQNQIERIYKSAWHGLICLAGILEYRNHRTRAAKVLAVGLIAFHTDAAVCDWLDVPTTPQRFLKKIL